MGIRDAILSAHKEASSCQYNYQEIYIADFSNRTDSQRSVEVSSSLQLCPLGGGLMDSAVFHNPSGMKVEFVQYSDYVFHDHSGINQEHCEGSLFPADESSVKWIVMLELKDCEVKNILRYASKARRQIFNVVKDLKTRGILTHEKIIGMYSCPRKHTDFNVMVFGDIIQQTRLKRKTGITYVGTNEIMLIDLNQCLPQSLG